MKRRRKSKNWVGKYFKLNNLTSKKLEVLSVAMNTSETGVVEQLIDAYYKVKFGDVDPKIALTLIKK